MLSTALNGILLAMLALLPTAAGSPRAGENPKEKKVVEDRVVVLNDGDVGFDDGDIEVDGDDPIVVHVGRGGFLGVRLIGITDELRAHFGAPKEAGVLVGGVDADSPAARAGIEVGDVITSVDGNRVDAASDVSRAIRRKKGGETAEVEVVRGGASRKMKVTLEERKVRERTIDLGDMGDRLRRHAWFWRDGELPGGGHMPRFKIENLEELPDLRTRLDDLEKRLKELEKKLGR
jgi:membrane-associated protease RseP (regulator of RpoE activity)